MNTTHRVPREHDLAPAVAQAQREALTRLAARHVDENRHRRRVLVLVLAVVGAALAVAPAVAVGQKLVSIVSNEGPRNVMPNDAEAKTGVRPTIHNRTAYEGRPLAVQMYDSGDGRLCVGTWRGPDDYGTYCVPPARLFAKGPVAVFGPTTAQIAAEGNDASDWDRMYLYGVSKPGVARVTVVMTNCDEREAALDADGVFLFTVPPSDLYADNWADQVRAYNRAGKLVWQDKLHTIRADDTPAPVTRPACRL